MTNMVSIYVESLTNHKVLIMAYFKTIA